ncbi:hypothetical protein GL2_30960 [Microbulbifer sp. GL-2]|nr:hypothetical protein GL2_30960 [Microbulbifer sp. GL-2]
MVAAQAVAATGEENKQKARALIQRLEQEYLSSEVPTIVQKLQKNILPISVLQAFALEQNLIIPSDLRNNALSLHRFGGSPRKSTRQFFTRLVTGEVKAGEQLPAFIQALNITPSQIDLYQPLAGAQAYPAYTTWLANYASSSEIAAALLINFQSFGQSIGHMAQALKKHKGMSDSQIEFLLTFSKLPSGFRGQAIDIISEGLASGVRESDIETRVRLIQSYERDFWRALNDVSKAAKT